MTWLLDTNVLLRISHPQDPQFDVCNRARTKLLHGGDDLAFLPQSLYELWVVATRPVAMNGYGLPTQEADSWIHHALSFGTLLAETSHLFPTWLDLVRRHGVTGKPAHDARLVAGMLVHNVSHILTFNTSDFARYPVTAVSPHAV